METTTVERVVSTIGVPSAFLLGVLWMVSKGAAWARPWLESIFQEHLKLLRETREMVTRHGDALGRNTESLDNLVQSLKETQT